MKPLSPPQRLACALVWFALLLLAGGWLSANLKMSGDLRKFMPTPVTAEQRLLMDELGEGPGSRLILVALSGADDQTLATQSTAMAGALSSDPQFLLVANGGAQSLDAIPGHLRPYRYLLSPTLDRQRLDADYLRRELDERIADLGSPAAGLLEPLIPADPTLETLKLAESWQPAGGPRRLHEVWFSRDGKRALLVAETRAPGFDPTGQAAAVNAIRAAFEAARGASRSTMEMSGPGPISVVIGGRTAREASWIGTLDGIGLVLLLLIAYRSWRQPLFGILPLASAGIAGLAAVALLFDGMHGITVAFGFTLIGVVQDYPVHLFSHQRPGVTPWQNARAIWPTLATGVASTCIAYLTFLVSGVDGLKQLAAFTIAGLLAAALSTRFILPALIDPDPRDPADSRFIGALWRGIERVPRPRAWMLAALALLSLAVMLFAPGPFWENDLSKLTPVPKELMLRDARLRGELGAPDVRYLIALDGQNAEEALRKSEALRPALDAMRETGAMAGYDMAARYLPSQATQRARQAKLPDAATLAATLREALANGDFQPDAFADFQRDVEAARQAGPLAPHDLAGTPLATSLAGLLREGGDRTRALISITGITDEGRFLAAAHAAGVRPIDMKAASESLVAQYRVRVLWSLAAAALLLAATVWFALRDPHRSARVLLPMALTTLLVLALLRGFGIELNLFHLVALILAAGLGLDYALFFDHAGDGIRDQLRTLHALIVCSLMTVLVFFLLALSSIPVLRAIGLPVTLGVLLNFILGLLIARQPATREERAHE
ncbi:hypothetical protein EBB59_06495 [Lysobacter pythonis]|uniref:Membrane transport protein MMPL domain-containing protein n=1 Tax=Solilutibacter pythonis TaxID=2483112 RepID=A0A3M2HTY1_9GAMM|nr:MMPL family transporter [Lysobacter pythonis]RMH93181.1 hypothetical protein EBB59_06495 [Lysobacter pythonis]